MDKRLQYDTKNVNMPPMKSYLILVTGALMALVSCSQPSPYGNGPTLTRLTPKESPAHRQYMARPGQGVVDTHSSDPDEAFEAQLEAYTGQTATDPNTAFVPAYPQADVQTNVVTDQTATQFVNQTPGVVSSYTPQPAVPQPAADGSAGYGIQIYNATNGRIFVEMHDDSDNIFPVASMYASQKISTQPAEPRPIQGQLTLIIRDPDQPGAPELRRYKVSTPPQGYMGKTISITILSGGRYRAAVDGEVYYATPEPTEKPAETPAPAAPAPAATPAATPAA